MTEREARYYLHHAGRFICYSVAADIQFFSENCLLVFYIFFYVTLYDWVTLSDELKRHHTLPLKEYDQQNAFKISIEMEK